MTKTRQKIVDTLLASRNVLVTGHKNPDGDSLGSMLGLAGFLESRGVPHVLVNEGPIPGKYRFLPGIEKVLNITDVDDVDTFDTAVIIECSNLDRIGEVNRLIDDGCMIINIDHHMYNVPFGTINLKDTNASAAGEMIFDLLNHGQFPISREMATDLYTAILTDTGRFHYSSTTPHCLHVAGELLELGADPVEITECVYFNLPASLMRLMGTVLSGLEYHFGIKDKVV